MLSSHMGLAVYILKCSDNSYYTGVTKNVELRVNFHNKGIDRTSYTYSRRPVILLWNNTFQSNIEAIAWEKRIKGWSRKKKEALINGDFDLLHQLAACKNKSHFITAKE